MSAYVYRGKVRKEDLTIPEWFDDTACGTYKGYRRHKRQDVTACDPCMEAAAAYAREYSRQKAGLVPEGRPVVRRGPGKNSGGCGTLGGHAAHRRLGTKACEECRVAYNAYKKSRRIATGVTLKVTVAADLSCPNCGHHVLAAA